MCVCVCLCARAEIFAQTEIFVQADKHLHKLRDVGTKREMSAQTWGDVRRLREIHKPTRTLFAAHYMPVFFSPFGLQCTCYVFFLLSHIFHYL
jgi:hypothetical protein